MSLLTDLVQSIIDMPGEFAGVMAQGPVEALLVVMGAVLVTVPAAFFAVLVAGAAIEFVVPDSVRETHP